MVSNEKQNLEENIEDINQQIHSIKQEIDLKTADYKNKLENKKFFENFDYDFKTAIDLLHLKLSDLERKKQELVHMLKNL